MRTIVVHNGIEYKSASKDSIDKELFLELYDEINQLTKFKMELEGGGLVMFGQKVIENSVIIFVPDEDTEIRNSV